MKVNASDSFIQSLRRLRWHSNPIYRIWETVRYSIPQFFKNIWRFRKVLWRHRWWDYGFTLEALATSLKILGDGLDVKGIEEDSSRGKKVAKIKRAVYLIERIRTNSYLDDAELELGKSDMDRPFEFIQVDKGYELVDSATDEEKAHRRRVIERSREIEEAEWAELWQILKGQDYSKFNKEQDWYEQFDGSGLKGWWD